MENGMASDKDGDFARLLDDLFEAASPQSDTSDSDASSSAVTVPFDYLSVVNELHSGRIRVSAQEAAAEYGVNAQINEILREFDARRAEIVPPPLELEQWPSIDPAEIAAELDLGKWRRPEDLARIRRSFAFDNHPDRVGAHLRDHAITRMQIANMLIDEAQRRHKR